MFLEEEIDERFNPYSPGFSIYLTNRKMGLSDIIKASILIHLDFLSILMQLVKKEWMQLMLQSLFTWIFYLFHNSWNEEQIQGELQSLFTWIFYLFRRRPNNTKSAIKLQSLFTWIFYLFQL